MFALLAIAFYRPRRRPTGPADAQLYTVERFVR